MTTFEQIVGTSTLDVVVPNTSLGFPTADVDQQQWLRRLSAGDVERKLAFFASLQMSISTFCSYYAWRHQKRLFPIPPWLRYHFYPFWRTLRYPMTRPTSLPCRSPPPQHPAW
ncbi:hypothetical protein FA95DRAFT_1576348, partial [Auriscalpium vulgare]